MGLWQLRISAKPPHAQPTLLSLEGSDFISPAVIQADVIFRRQRQLQLGVYGGGDGGCEREWDWGGPEESSTLWTMPMSGALLHL